VLSHRVEASALILQKSLQVLQLEALSQPSSSKFKDKFFFEGRIEQCPKLLQPITLFNHQEDA
jgi:hypothetical protein